MKIGSFDTETINRVGHGEACLLIKKAPDKSVEFLEFPRSFSDIFDFLASAHPSNPRLNWACWNMDFDARAILHPFFLPWQKLMDLGNREIIRNRNYRIKYIPGKRLEISKTGRGFVLYDARQFYASSLAAASLKYLPVDSRKKSIPKSWYKEIDKCLKDGRRNRILRYAEFDALAVEALVKRLLDSYSSVGLNPVKLTSSASLAASFFGSKFPKGINPPGVNRAFLPAFYGGRIEIFKLGEIKAPLELYDIHSAYPSGIAELRPFTDRLYTSRPRGPSYSVHNFRIKIPWTWKIGPCAVRDRRGRVFFPVGEFKTWGTGLMLDFLKSQGLRPEIENSFYLPITGESLWPETEALYEKRKDESRSLAIKLILNSWYGKLAESGHRAGEFGRFCCFPWSAYITEKTRIQLTRALYDLESLGHEPVFSATDGILVKKNGLIEKLRPALSTGPKLGQWGEPEKFDRAVVIGCGRYFLYRKGELIKSHLRGFPSGIPPESLNIRKSSKKINLLSCLSLREWSRAHAMPEFNVLEKMPHLLRIEDDKRAWPLMPKTLADAFNSEYNSSSLILGQNAKRRFRIPKKGLRASSNRRIN